MKLWELCVSEDVGGGEGGEVRPGWDGIKSSENSDVSSIDVVEEDRERMRDLREYE